MDVSRSQITASSPTYVLCLFRGTTRDIPRYAAAVPAACRGTTAPTRTTASFTETLRTPILNPNPWALPQHVAGGTTKKLK